MFGDVDVFWRNFISSSFSIGTFLSQLVHPYAGSSRAHASIGTASTRMCVFSSYFFPPQVQSPDCTYRYSTGVRTRTCIGATVVEYCSSQRHLSTHAALSLASPFIKVALSQRFNVNVMTTIF